MAAAHYDRGIAFDDQKQCDLAIADFTQAIILYPKYIEAYENRGGAYRGKGLKPQALADFELYLHLAPDASDRAQVEQWISELKGQ